MILEALRSLVLDMTYLSPTIIVEMNIDIPPLTQPTACLLTLPKNGHHRGHLEILMRSLAINMIPGRLDIQPIATIPPLGILLLTPNCVDMIKRRDTHGQEKYPQLCH